MGKRKSISLTLILGLISIGYSQNNNAIAKIRYQEAEELYEKGSYELSLKKLEQVESLLKSSNSKILYLKILIEDTLYKSERRQKIPSFKTTNAIQKDLKYFMSSYYSVSDEKLSQVIKIDEYYDTIPSNFGEYKGWFENRLNYWTNKKGEFENLLIQQEKISADIEIEIQKIIKKRKGSTQRFFVVGLGMFMMLPVWANVRERIDVDPMSWLPIGVVGGGGLLYMILAGNELSSNDYSRFYAEEARLLAESKQNETELKRYINWINGIVNNSKL
jgi:hypothetical protein